MVELNRIYLYQRATILSLLVMMLPGCATQRIVEWPAIEGHVLEETTDKPIEDAIVVALWKGTAPYTTSVCFHVESTTTDDEGHYVIPAWRNEGKWNNLDGQYVSIYAHKARYEWAIDFDDPAWLEERGQVDKHLRKYQSTNSGLILTNLKRVEEMTRCRAENENLEDRGLLVAELYEEAKQTASTKQDQHIVDSLRYILESFEIGDENALKNLIERRNDRGD